MVSVCLPRRRSWSRWVVLLTGFWLCASSSLSSNALAQAGAAAKSAAPPQAKTAPAQMKEATAPAKEAAVAPDVAPHR